MLINMNDMCLIIITLCGIIFAEIYFGCAFYWILICFGGLKPLKPCSNSAHAIKQG